MTPTQSSRFFRHITPDRFLLLLLPFLGSCGREAIPAPRSAPLTRTVLVYLAGDNDLGDLSVIPELLRQGWRYTCNKCLIYYDAPEAAPKLYTLTCEHPGAIPTLETAAEYDEENSASPEVFGQVLADVVRKYPSDSYGLIFASHGSGWLPVGTLSNPTRSIGADRNPGAVGGVAEMEIADFAAAIPDRQLDFIVFEACLMSGVEVAYALRNKTDYILASSAELLVPGYVPIYPEASHYLFDTSLKVPEALSKFAGCYFEHMNSLDGAYRSATQSIVCTREMDALATLMTEVSEDSKLFADDAVLCKLQHFDRPGSYGDTPAQPRYFDFGEYLTRLAPERQAETDALLARIVVWKSATPEFMSGYNGFAIRTHSGLTTYIEQAAFPRLNAAYEKTAWWKATHRQS